jgi:hypothetical protein
MTLKRTTIIFVGVVALAAWFAAAMTPGRPPVAPVVVVATPLDAGGEALANEISRLRQRLRPEPAPHEPTRNPFAFRSRRAAPPVQAPAPPPIDAAAAAAETSANGADAAPRLSLAGIAEDPGPEGPVRTAIIAGSTQLFLARVGDTVVDRGVEYAVESIMADSVGIKAMRDGTTHRLTLK